MAKLMHGEIPAGNWEDKYNSPNPIARYLVGKFLDSLTSFVVEVAGEIDSISEIGCGEGMISCLLSELGVVESILGCDISPDVVSQAKKNAVVLSGRCKPVFYTKDIYDVTKQAEGADLVICCEVLEHVPDPRKALCLLREITGKYCLLSVPNEPLWRVMNMARGKYWGAMGNTPGHINHWSSKSFIELVSSELDVLQVAKPIPWTILLCRHR